MYNEYKIDSRRSEETIKHFYTYETTEISIVVIENFNIHYLDQSVDINTIIIRRTKIQIQFYKKRELCLTELYKEATYRRERVLDLSQITSKIA